MNASGEEFRKQQEAGSQPQPVTERHLTDVEEVNTNLQHTIDTLQERITDLEAALERSMSVATGLIPAWTPQLRRWLISAQQALHPTDAPEPLTALSKATKITIIDTTRADGVPVSVDVELPKP